MKTRTTNVFDFCLNDVHKEAGKTGMNSSSAPHIHFLLDDLQSPINIGKCARIAEIYGMELYIHDPRNLTADPNALQTISDFACGAWQRRTNHIHDNIQSLVGNYKKGRLIATCLDKDAIPLQDFEFKADDLIMLGNEYDGLPAELIDGADAKVYIPMPQTHLPKFRSYSPIDPSRIAAVNQNGNPNLNVAVSAGIIGYAFSCWLEKKRYLSTEFQEIQINESCYS